MKREFGNLRKDLQAGPSSETLSGACNTQEEDEEGEQSFCVTLPCSTFEEFDALESELKSSRDKRRAMFTKYRITLYNFTPQKYK